MAPCASGLVLERFMNLLGCQFDSSKDLNKTKMCVDFKKTGACKRGVVPWLSVKDEMVRDSTEGVRVGFFARLSSLYIPKGLLCFNCFPLSLCSSLPVLGRT